MARGYVYFRNSWGSKRIECILGLTPAPNLAGMLISTSVVEIQSLRGQVLPTQLNSNNSLPVWYQPFVVQAQFEFNLWQRHD
jgi:hypothetical protein